MTDGLLAPGTLRHGFATQLSVVWALIFKDYKIRLGHSRLGIVWALGEPIMHVVVLSLIWLVMKRDAILGVPLAFFLGTGVLFALLIQKALNTIPQAINASRSLLDYPQVKPFDCLLARFVLEATFLCLSGALLFAVEIWLGDYVPPVPDPLRFCLLLGLAWCIAFGIGLGVGVYATLYPAVGRIAGLAGRPLMPLSAAFYPASHLPGEFREILSWNPVLQIVELSRVFLFDTKPFPELDMGYVSLWAAASLSLGLIAVHANRYELVRR